MDNILNSIHVSLRKKAENSPSRLMALIATLSDYLRYKISFRVNYSKATHTGESVSLYQEVKKNGICIVANYWDETKCAKARLEIDRLINEYPEYINPRPQADTRIFGAESLSELISEFSSSPSFEAVANAYNGIPTGNAFTMAAKMPFKSNNPGSGDGWHRDAFFRQFKAIIYLSDVELENGPFQFVKGSHRLLNVLKDLWVGGLSYMQYRIRDDQIDKIIKKNPARLTTYTAKAGTLILVDTSSIHRGMPIEKGVRYALTNYYFPKTRITECLYKQFSPVANKS